MDAILHIGSGRTGSTSLQQWMVNNEEFLNKNKIGIVKTVGKGNNIDIPKSCFKKLNNPFFKRNMIKSFKDWNLFRDNTINILKKEISEIKSSGIEKVIISSEHFTTDLRDLEDVISVRELFDLSGVEIKSIILYARDQASYLMSEICNKLSMGMPVNVIPDVNSKLLNTSLNHQKTIQMWTEVFCKAELFVRKFDRNTLVGNNVITDFMSLLNLDVTVNESGSTNFSFSNDAAQILSQVNQRLYESGFDLSIRENYESFVVLKNWIVFNYRGNKLTYDRAVFDQIKSLFIDVNSFTESYLEDNICVLNEEYGQSLDKLNDDVEKRFDSFISKVSQSSISSELSVVALFHR